MRSRRTLFGECFAHNFADLDEPMANLSERWAIEGGMKLILPREPARRPELYDILADPGETRDLAGERPAEADALRKKLDAWWWPGV